MIPVFQAISFILFSKSLNSPVISPNSPWAHFVNCSLLSREISFDEDDADIAANYESFKNDLKVDYKTKKNSSYWSKKSFTEIKP